mgnify:CR=1 FL=1
MEKILELKNLQKYFATQKAVDDISFDIAKGSIFGLFGRTFCLFGWQQGLSIAAGVLMLIVFFSSAKFPTWIKKKFNVHKPYLWLSKIMKMANGTSSFFAAGLINGLLPCGLIYIAAGTALASGSLLHGALVMIFFGIGTIPLLTTALLISKLITLPIREKFKKLMPYFVVVIASLLIIRGLNLHVPNLSPALVGNGNTVSCHAE